MGGKKRRRKRRRKKYVTVYATLVVLTRGCNTKVNWSFVILKEEKKKERKKKKKGRKEGREEEGEDGKFEKFEDRSGKWGCNCVVISIAQLYSPHISLDFSNWLFCISDIRLCGKQVNVGKLAMQRLRKGFSFAINSSDN